MRISDWSSDVCSSDLIRIEGPVEKVSEQEGDAYFATRSRDSQPGAWASDQSRPPDNRHTLEARFDEVQARFEGQEVPRQPHWSGFRAIPGRIARKRVGCGMI